MSDTRPLDLIIIGGGIGGIICLKYAESAGLNALLFERNSGVGGIWRDLPAWQDIQIRKEDWTLGSVPIAGIDQASIQRNIQAWVDRFKLAPSVRLNANVTSARPAGDGWEISVGAQTYRSRFLVAATGGHNRPLDGRPERIRPAILEYHSSTLREPAQISGKDVLVVGGGASAYDLLDLCFDNHARRVVWIYRSLKWMRPTRQPKQLAANLRLLARQQMLGVPITRMNHLINLDLSSRYRKAGIAEIMPEYEFDLRRHQLIPGRRGIIKNFDRIERHRGEILRIEDKRVKLSDGQCTEADMILWGTGYELDLRYFEVEALSRLTRFEELAQRCGSLFRSLDAPNLFFLAPGILGTTYSAPWVYAHAAKSIMSHIRGHPVFDTTPIPFNVNYFDLAKFLARRDHASYVPVFWYLKYLYAALCYPAKRPMPIP